MAEPFGLCMVNHAFGRTLVAKACPHAEKMIRDDKAKHAGSTKQTAASISTPPPPEENPPLLPGSDPRQSLNQR